MRIADPLRTAAAGFPAPSPASRPTVWPRRPRVLYFDIDGTLVRSTFGRAKRALAHGRFERAVRRAGFERVVCVSDAVLIARALAEGLPGGRDLHDVLFRFCQGTFEDPAWFRAAVALAHDPLDRAGEIDLEADWYFLDDNAWDYLRMAGVPAHEAAPRTLACDAGSEGHEVLAWLDGLAAPRTPGRRRASWRLPVGYVPSSRSSSSYARRRE